jgi:hypothetical protein
MSYQRRFLIIVYSLHQRIRVETTRQRWGATTVGWGRGNGRLWRALKLGSTGLALNPLLGQGRSRPQVSEVILSPVGEGNWCMVHELGSRLLWSIYYEVDGCQDAVLQTPASKRMCPDQNLVTPHPHLTQLSRLSRQKGLRTMNS